MTSYKHTNPRIKDNAGIPYNGEVHRLHKKTVRWSDLPDSPDYKKLFVYYDIIRTRDHAVIGRITKYTTDERLDSLLYRYYNRDHMRPFEFSARIYMSGSADDPDSTEGAVKTPYVIIPPDIISNADARVDDEIEMTVTGPDGYSNTQRYHISKMSRSYIMPLTQFKRLAYMEVNEEGAFQWASPHEGDARSYEVIPEDHLPKRNYKTQVGDNLFLVMMKKSVYKSGMDAVRNGDECPFCLFIKEGDVINVSVRPAPMRDGRRCFDFAKNTLDHINNVKLMEQIHRKAMDRERSTADVPSPPIIPTLCDTEHQPPQDS